MKTDGAKRIGWRRARMAGLAAMALVATAACAHIGHMLGGNGIPRPPVQEFGLGPRASGAGAYSATLVTQAPLRTRTLQTVHLAVRDTEGRPVEGATITVDGGMPQHDHGLPTQPRVTRDLGDGTYEVQGVRFNMGGWWELRFIIDGSAGPDTVTFNLDV